MTANKAPPPTAAKCPHTKAKRRRYAGVQTLYEIKKIKNTRTLLNKRKSIDYTLFISLIIKTNVLNYGKLITTITTRSLYT